VGLRDKIRHKWSQVKDWDHPFAALWHWASAPDSLRARRNRFRAYKSFAVDRFHAAKKNGWNASQWWKAIQATDKKIKWLNQHIDPKPQPDGDHFMTFDGRVVPEWIGQILQEARNDGVYFVVISGYRTPEYSQSLCCHMCGACAMGTTCPGRCAGIYSNHACPPSHTGVEFEGAVDVSPGYGALESWCRRNNKPLYGGGYALPSDLPHFSHTGR